jgi:cell division protein FtsQ
VSRGLISPRGRPPALGDFGDPATAVAGQRVPRGRRRRPRRPIPWRQVFGAVALVAGTAVAVVMAGHWVLTSPRFAVVAVEVRGASRVPPQRILEISGIVHGTNLWRIDPGQVRGRLEALPEIRRADVVRELPNRVSILVEERRPFTLVHSARLHWLDEDGRLLGEERNAVATDVPVISGLSEDELVTMRTKPGPRARAAITLIRALLRTGSALTAEISEIDMSRSEGPVLYTVDGVEVRLGSEEWEERLARLEGVLSQVATGDVQGVDLRFRDQVVLRRGPGR